MICTPHLILTGDKIAKNKMVSACTTYEERRGVCRDLLGKPERKRPFGGPKYRWDNFVVSLYTWQHISHMLHVVNQGARKFSLTTQTNRSNSSSALT